MKCKKVKRLLSPHFDGELEPALANQVANHLDICLGCAEEFRRLSRLRTLITQDTSAMPPPFFWEGVKARIEEREAASELAPRRTRLVYGLALTALLLGGLFAILLMEAGRLVTISDYLRSTLPRQGRTHFLLSDREVNPETVLRLIILPEPAFAGERNGDDSYDY